MVWRRAFATRGSANCYYRVLGVQQTASMEAIKAAYFTLAKKHHPDTNSEDEKTTAQDKFQKISEAYEFLCDSENRRLYDSASSRSDPSNFDDGPTLDDLISKVRRNISKQYRSQMTPIPPVQVKLVVEFEKMLEKNQMHELTFQAYSQCEACRGLGTNFSSCEACLRGKPTCDCSNKCLTCNGKGKTWTANKTTKVNLPRGVRNGEVLVLKHLGHWTKTNGVGDLHVEVEIRKHSMYARHDTNRYDLKAVVKVSLVESLLGGKHRLVGSNIDDVDEFRVDVPPLCRPGHLLRFPQHGLPKTPHSRGELVCEIMVESPQFPLSSRQVKILEEFQFQERNKTR